MNIDKNNVALFDVWAYFIITQMTKFKICRIILEKISDFTFFLNGLLIFTQNINHVHTENTEKHYLWFNVDVLVFVQ